MRTIDYRAYNEYLNTATKIQGGSDYHKMMVQGSEDARKVMAKINHEYHTSTELHQLFQELTGKELDTSLTIFPPFYTDYGKNTTFGKNVFVNAGCHFQDQGGITIEDNSLIGHNVVLATLNHGFLPSAGGVYKFLNDSNQPFY